MKLQVEHLEAIAAFLQNHPDFAKGRLSVSNARNKFKELWTQLSQSLNALGLGEKPLEKWQKSWSDYKGNLKKKTAEIKRHREATGGGPPLKDLTDLEKLILDILGTTFFMGIGIEEKGISVPKLNPENTSNSNENKMAMPSTSKETVCQDTPPKPSLKPTEETLNYITDGSSKKRTINDTIQDDHDYLFFKNVKNTNKKPKTKENNMKNAYLETIECLKTIENTVALGLSNINESIKHGFQSLRDLHEK